MYPINPRHRRIRDTPSTYGERWPEHESFPAESALRDLTAVPENEIPRVLARYAVLRFWLLATARSPSAVVDHARESAAAHLSFAAADWGEAVALRRLLDRPEPFDDASAAAAAATEAAEAEGHRHGAYATLRSAYRVARRRPDLDRAAGHARALAALMRRYGATLTADRWERRARRLDRAAGGCVPPRAG